MNLGRFHTVQALLFLLLAPLLFSIAVSVQAAPAGLSKDDWKILYPQEARLLKAYNGLVSRLRLHGANMDHDVFQTYRAIDHPIPTLPDERALTLFERIRKINTLMASFGPDGNIHNPSWQLENLRNQQMGRDTPQRSRLVEIKERLATLQRLYDQAQHEYALATTFGGGGGGADEAAHRARLQQSMPYVYDNFQVAAREVSASLDHLRDRITQIGVYDLAALKSRLGPMRNRVRPL
ncbi:uncharacterized protein PSFLO_04383 [Pseudozyma flocculosa]|nr:uncharacterized protein PSFLO_04383 [Pseudozyma flocculosa]